MNKKFKPDQQNKIKQKTYFNLSNTIPENLRDKQNKKISGAEVWRVKSRDRIIYHGCTGPNLFYKNYQASMIKNNADPI